ncbi:Uncharacterised protein [Streptococcus pneumoniae]|nr:Uncharacterised protein [Streptococcus pneumoniae]
MNMNSIGSVTPVKNTANAADKNIGLYFARFSLSTLRNIAKAIPINAAVEPITCPALKRAGTTLFNRSLYAFVSPFANKLFKSVIHASHKGSCPATTCPIFEPVNIVYVPPSSV